MKVYLAACGEYEERCIIGVFFTEEEANKCSLEGNERNFPYWSKDRQVPDVEEWEVLEKW
jgi:hypothetical protein